MNFRHAAILSALVLSGCATQQVAAPPPAASAPSKPDMFFAESFSCRPAETAAVDIVRLRQDGATFKDKCVRVSAFANGRELLRDARESGTAIAKSLGAYWQRGEAFERLKRGPSFIEATGRLRACHDVLTRSEPPPGQCHGDAGYALFVSAVRIIPTAMD